MGWKSPAAGAILLLIALSYVAAILGAFLFATNLTCAATSSTTTSSDPRLFGSTSNASIGAAAPLAPVPLVAADLVLTPLADLSLIPRGGNSTGVADLADLAYWQQIHASEYQIYEQILQQTVLGLFNSSQEWRDWALQHIPDSRDWLAIGFVTEAKGQVMVVDPGSASPGVDNSTAVARAVRSFAASTAGLTASLDFVSFNGVTALKVLFETRDLILAACQTLPGQLAQLYESSFDPAVPRDVRAQYLGRSLAITSVMLLLGGKDGFTDHFKTAIDGVGLSDSWPAVKPYLGDIASKASAGASSATFAVLQRIARRFPQDSMWATGLTADRIDSMVDVLHDERVSDTTIRADIEHVDQAARSTNDEQAAGEAADASSLRHGGGMLVKIKTGNKIVLYDDGNGRTANIRGTFLKQIIPGFDPRGPNFVSIQYQEAGVTVYHYYDQKVAPDQSFEPKDTEWNPRAPGIVGQKDDVVTVNFELLTPEKFLNSVPQIDYLNTARAAWVSGFSEVKSFQLIGDTVRMNGLQEPINGVSSFTIDGTFDSMQNSNGDTSVLFSIPNILDKSRVMKITFDGYGEPVLGISSSSNYSPVTSISSDGTRLRVVSNSGGSAVTTSTLYMRDPSPGWSLGAMTEEDLGFQVQGASQTFRIGKVTAVDTIDDGLVHSMSKIDLGRAGGRNRL
jgi:hypothetical protein